MTNNKFANKHILISGGSSGIGLALAKEFYSRGANVTILARRKHILKKAAKEIESFRANPGQKVSLISADVTKFNNLKSSLENDRADFDVLINSAGFTYPGIFSELDIEIFYKVMDENYFGTVNLTKLIVPEMISNGSGYIINISSLAAAGGIYGYTAYAPSKYAVRGFSRCLRSELKAHGIDVSVVLPSDTDTPQLEFERTLLPEITRQINENGGVMTPESVAKSIIRGMKKKQFTIIPGLKIKLLYLIAPILDRYFYHFAVRKRKQEIT